MSLERFADETARIIRAKREAEAREKAEAEAPKLVDASPTGDPDAIFEIIPASDAPLKTILHDGVPDDPERVYVVRDLSLPLRICWACGATLPLQGNCNCTAPDKPEDNG